MTRRVLGLACALLCGAAGPAVAQIAAETSVVQVFANDSASLAVPGVTRVMSLDEDVCRVEITGGEIRFHGRLVGDAVVFAWVGQERATLLVRVVQKPEPPRRVTLSSSAQSALGQGRAGMSVMASDGAAGNPFVTHQYWDWQQRRNGARLAVRGFTNTYTGGPHAFNLASLSIEHATATRTLTLADFTLQMGAAGDRAGSSSLGAYSVRGVDYAITSGRSRVELFAGTTVPAYFLDVAGMRGIAGARIDHAVNPAVRLHSALGVVKAPAGADPAAQHAILPFQTAGLVYAPSPAFSARGNAGVSQRGMLGDLEADYTGGRFAASAGISDTRGDFALGRLQLLTTGDSSVRATAGWTWGRIALASAARRTVSKPGGLGLFGGTAASLSQRVQVTLPYRQQLAGSVTRNASTNTALGAYTNTRVDGSWSAAFGSRVGNTLQVGTARNTDATQLDSYTELSIRDALTLSLPSGSLFATFEHQRLDPSLLGRVRQVVDALPPAMRDLYRVSPELFLDTVDLPADVRRLLETARPSSTAVSVGGQFTRGSVSLGPTLSVIADAPGTQTARMNYMVGYSATWQVSPTWQLRSSMTNRLYYDGSATGFRRSNVATLGLDKSFAGLPRWIVPAKAPVIEGRVYRDHDVDGVADPSDPGLPGVRVRLGDGRAVVTDGSGRFRFTGVKPGLHRVSIDLEAFSQAVRVTTPSDVTVEAVGGSSEVNFGVVNFARVIGNVFNDYNNDARRQNDAAGLPRVRVRITGGAFATEVRSDSSGDYEAVNLPPGEYAVSVNADDLPADYVAAAAPAIVTVAPTATAVADLPVRALRSISGRVLIRTAADQAPSPLEGVTVMAGGAIATTDAQGRYALRDLPAGLVEIRVLAARDLPAHLNAPRGVVRLTVEPMHLDNATIVVTNPGLLEYLMAPAAGDVK
jgi:hypothetical protein